MNSCYKTCNCSQDGTSLRAAVKVAVGIKRDTLTGRVVPQQQTRDGARLRGRHMDSIYYQSHEAQAGFTRHSATRISLATPDLPDRRG